MDKKTTEELAKLRADIEFKNPHILRDIVSFFQKVIVLAIGLENIDAKLTPRLVLGEENVETESSITRNYDEPVVYLTLKRRAPTGINENTLKDLFSNNLVSGIPKFERAVKKVVISDSGETEEYNVSGTMFKTDNELCLSLKTKTVKEQLTLLPVMERALNIYSQIVKPDFIDVCGVKNIETESKKDKTDFETARITFQLRVIEQVIFDDTYILKGFEILAQDSEFEGISSNSGRIDENKNWIDNVTEEYSEYFTG